MKGRKAVEKITEKPRVSRVLVFVDESNVISSAWTSNRSMEWLKLRDFFSDEKLNVHDLLETQRLEEIARRIHTRPADRRPDLVPMHREAERTEECVLGVFHHAVIICKMDDACHVRLGKLHAMGEGEFVRHPCVQLGQPR